MVGRAINVAQYGGAGCTLHRTLQRRQLPWGQLRLRGQVSCDYPAQYDYDESHGHSRMPKLFQKV
jgi:hypothetical protein